MIFKRENKTDRSSSAYHGKFEMKVKSMKTNILNSINKLGLVFLMLMSLFILGCRCSAPKPAPNPLVGFYHADEANLDKNKAITDDYKSYLQTLSPDEKKYVGPILFFEDGMGQHAVRIEQT